MQENHRHIQTTLDERHPARKWTVVWDSL